MLPVGVRRLRNYHSTRSAHYCLARVTSSSRAGECEADLDVFDQAGTVLLTVEGLRLAAGISEHERANRVFDERLLTIEWERGELPEVPQIDAGSWLLLSASEADPLTAQLADALNAVGAQSTSVASASDVAQLRSLLGGRLTGVVVVTGPPTGGLTQCGRDYVSQLVGIARELAELPGEPPRLFVVTRSAASVLPSDLANLEQAGLRGLMRVIDSEHPHLGATAIDVDNDETVAALVASQLQSGSQEDETAWRNGIWYTARLRPGPLRPAERRTAVVEYRRDGMRLQIRTPGDLESLEFVTFDRVPPGPGEIEVAVTASSVNFADVLVAFGRYPTFEGYRQQLGIDFAGVVTAVGPDVTEHRIGDHVGGMSANGCWSTFVRCDARLAVTLPPELPVAAAAAVPTASATAWYALHDLARICSDDKVLIHSGPVVSGRRRSRSHGPPDARSSPPRAVPSGDNCCTTWVSSMSTTHGAPSSPSRSEATPMGMVSTSYSTRCPAPHNVLGSNCWPLAGDSWRSANVTSTATLGSGCSRSAATCRCMPSTWRC
ncbi:polyketide beta-ketoacyl synthase [Mycobacterium tuberculosis variant bovis BCG]|nr:polyketide beta-ketoacyl synthase [Mycobacterium tuberculosis variant bovis BCG]